MTGAVLTAVVLLGGALWGILWFGRGAWLKISSALLVLQPVGLPPVPALWQLGTSPYMLWRAGGLLRSPVPTLLVAFAGLNAASAAWSPQPRVAVLYGILVVLVVALAFHGALVVARDNPGAIGATLWLLSPVVAAQCLSTIAFRLDQGLELTYYASAPARLLLGANSGAVASGQIVNNVLDPAKAGGILFLNGNRASMVMGVMALVYAMYALRRNSRAAGVMAAVCAMGCAFSGSKTGIALLVVTPVIAIFWAVMARSNSSTKIVSILTLTFVVIATVFAVPRYASDYVERSDEALVPRRVLWSTAIDAGTTHPWRGLGFGGWESYANQRLPGEIFRGISPVVFDPNYPPHNMLLFSMTRVGFLGPLLILGITAAAIGLCVRRVGDQSAFSTRVTMTMGAAAWIWVFVHAMGDNTEVWGTFNSVPFLAIALAICVGIREGTDEGPPEREDPRPRRQPAEPVAARRIAAR